MCDNKKRCNSSTRKKERKNWTRWRVSRMEKKKIWKRKRMKAKKKERRIWMKSKLKELFGFFV